ncbi:hypothetical protein [Streptomyces sp. SJL17-1]|uniref:hypothetical protein n=1 Tax=Streptomyces sp. SJL17-1 TaxID=2967223 RepID=UPI0029661291|nr:hypothetical protein [Streptomyces sp. SJL17-1]
MRRLSLPRATTALAVGLAAVVATAASPAAADTSWRDVSPADSNGSVLYDVETAGGATWAVGLRSDATTRPFAPVAMRWTGKGWQAPPQPADHGRLDDLAVGAPDEVWAVGTRNETVGETDWDRGRALLQHWNGTAWSEVALPFPEGAGDTSLSAVDVDAAGSVWVYGGYADPAGEYVPVMFRGDADGGGGWTRLPADTGLTWVAQLEVGPGGVAHAIGDGVSRFDGRSWTRQSLPPSLDGAMYDGIEMRAANDIWAVGHIRDEKLWRRPVIVRYDGRAWRTVRTPAETGQLFDIAFDGSGSPVVVGETMDPAVNPAGNYVLTPGPRGFLTRTEEPPGAGYLYGAATDEAGRVWTVGGTAGAEGGISPSAYAGIRR